jgi:hypothetical protein
MLTGRYTSRQASQRRGVLLIVVLALLSLFAIVGITFVFFAGGKAEYARITAEIQNPGTLQFSDDGSAAFNTFLANLIYPAIPPSATAPATSYFNALRGHDLTTLMYGGQAGSILPWSGIGLFNEPVTAPEYAGLNRRQIVNFTLYPGMNVILDPEYSNPAGRPPAASVAGVYIPKNAPYTYPDVNNYFLAALCPATGEVLLPSFHRPQLFGPLDPSNPNWTNPQGRYLTLRPRPAEHPNFPPIPQNPDGSYTGDVQNLRGSVGVQRNDSLWMDIGLPPIVAPNGKRYKPLIAPLIVDLDGRLNLSVHGNLLNGGAHSSGSGLGPWEVSLEKAAAAFGGNILEARQLVAIRSANLMNRAGVTNRAFVPYLVPLNTQLPRYAQVPWSGLTGANALLIPGQGGPPTLYLDAPVYSNGYDSTNNPVPRHPSLYHPNEWPPFASAGTPRTYSFADLKLLHFAYAALPSEYAQLEVGMFASSFLGTAGPGSFPDTLIAANTFNNYRIKPSHRNRMIFTTHSYSLDRPGGLGYYFDGTALAPHPLANLPPVNLNRPLADYRNDFSQPLSPTNLGSLAQAQQDRQNLARDIFVRLVAVTLPTVMTSWNPANGQYTFHPTINPANPTYPQLRILAQIAVNIVDYIDNDDIMTPFPWDPNTPTEVVYGVEKPRLVINEVYSEVTNDPADPTFGVVPMPAALPAHVRFWVELHNPTSTPYTGGPTAGPLGDGSVTLHNGNFNPYRLLIAQNPGGKIGIVVRDPANNTGDPGVAQLTFNFGPAAGTPVATVPPANGNPAAGMVLCAANVPQVHAASEFNPIYPAGTPVIPAAPVGNPDSLTYPFPLNQALNANTLNPVLKDHIVVLQRLADPYQPPGPNNPYITVDYMEHVPSFDAIQRESGAILDRNPKQWNNGMVQPGYDPIDIPGMGDPIVRRHALGKVQPLAGQCTPQPPAPNTDYPIYDFPASLAVRQEPLDNTGNLVAGVRHTFLRQNSRTPTPPAATTFNPGPPASLANNETLMVPYDWLVHLDRPLINPLELLHVTWGRPHDLTQQFLTSNGNAITKFTGSMEQLLRQNPQFAMLYRALDLLRIQPHISGVPLGGRIAGRININTLQDKRVWDALLDVQAGNSFDQGFVDNAWSILLGSRTPNMQSRLAADGTQHPCPVPGATVYDTNLGSGGRPFVPFGVSTVPPSGTGVPIAGSGATAYGGGLGLVTDTLLRGSISGGNFVPYMTVLPPNALHPYQSAEALRKIFNNVTTVSHTFAVWVTVGYFEVEAELPTTVPGVNFTRLGREYYREVPGDTRFQFFAIVDRSMIAVDPGSYLAFRNGTGNLSHAQQPPFFTTLEANAPAGINTLQIYAPGDAGWNQGQPVPLTPGQLLAVGIGAAMDIVPIQAVGPVQPNGTVGVTLGAPLSHTHYVGDCVSNVIPANPGPQPNFDVHLPSYRHVVPFWTRLR